MNRPRSKTISRAAGRPPAEQRTDAKARLIRTAAECFAARGYEATSLKQVAEGAGVTPAMVAYYFKDKSGLLEAVVVDGLERLLTALQAAVADHEPEAFVPRLIRGYLATISASPWIPQLLMREVISKDSPLRVLFVERFARQAFDLVPDKVREEMRAGRLDKTFDPRFTIMSLLGICVFPFLAHPVLGALMGYELNESFGEEYAEHAVRLFLAGSGGES